MKAEVGLVKDERLLFFQGKGSKEEQNLGERNKIWKELILDGLDFVKKKGTKSSTNKNQVVKRLTIGKIGKNFEQLQSTLNYRQQYISEH